MEDKTKPAAPIIHSPLKEAICKFKAQNIVIKKESSNPFFKSRYADLATILDAVEVKAAGFGLVITSVTKLVEGTWMLETTLEHKDSDEVKISWFPIFGTKPQEYGSSITYARRYNIQSLLNLAAEDDDGNAANSAPLAQNNFTNAGHHKTSGAEILAAMNGCENLQELEQAKEDYKQDINRYKFSKLKTDNEFYDQIIARGAELKKIFEQLTPKE